MRDQIAHRRSVPGGQFTRWFRPGRPVAVELNGGGEHLPLLGDHTQAPGRLCAILLDRLLRFEDTFTDLAGRESRGYPAARVATGRARTAHVLFENAASKATDDGAKSVRRT